MTGAMTVSPEKVLTGPLRVALVDDHQVLVDALRLSIQAQKDMEVVGTGGTCAECLDLARRAQPQVLLLDVHLPDGDGIEQIPAIHEACPGINILILTSFSDEAALLRAMQAGANGFLSKSRNLVDVLKAIRQAALGEIVMPAAPLIGLLNRATRERKSSGLPVNTLTPREREILSLLAQGKTAEEIASLLVIAPLTVRTHIRNLLQKLGARTRLQAVTLALKQGLIEPPA